MGTLLTTRETAELLGVGTTSIKRWAEQGVLECLKTAGGHRRFDADEVERFRRSTSLDTAGTTLASMRPAELDALPYGVVRVGDDGKVLYYNATEADFAGIEARRVDGLDFFTEVAPCTNNRLVRGRFLAGVAAGAFDFTLDYTFTYRMRPTPVRLRVFRDEQTDTNWVVVHARGMAGDPA